MTMLLKSNKSMDRINHKELTKTRKALDWALSCIIRLPIAVVFLAVALAAVGFIALIFAPENVLNALRFLGVVI